MSFEEENNMAIAAYPDFIGPCDKPNIQEDTQVIRLQREACRQGLRDALKSLWKSTKVFPEITCRVVLHLNGQVVLGAYGDEHGMFYSDNDSCFRSRKWSELPEGQWLNLTNILPNKLS